MLIFIFIDQTTSYCHTVLITIYSEQFVNCNVASWATWQVSAFKRREKPFCSVAWWCSIIYVGLRFWHDYTGYTVHDAWIMYDLARVRPRAFTRQCIHNRYRLYLPAFPHVQQPKTTPNTNACETRSLVREWSVMVSAPQINTCIIKSTDFKIFNSTDLSLKISKLKTEWQILLKRVTTN